MHWLIKCRSKPGTDALRTATIAAHSAFLDGYPEVTWYSGPLFTGDKYLQDQCKISVAIVFRLSETLHRFILRCRHTSLDCEP